MPPVNKHYRAFISYSHRDAKWAMWLHRSLERYVVPLDAYPSDKKLQRDLSKDNRRLSPIFRDRDEMPASVSLAATIHDALEESENLIVLCSPSAASSQYVNAEIEIFCKLRPGNKQKIYALIVEGEPPDCFPEALLADGAEPIAADARVEGDGKNDAKLKLIAGMLGVGFDRLKQREVKRQRNRLLATVAVVSTVAVMTSFLALWAMKERTLAKQAAAEAKAVLEFFEAKVLAVARPKEKEGGLGIDATIYEAVNVAEPQIEEAFVDRPLVEASIRYTLGRTYEHLGESKAAIKQFEKVLKLRKKNLGSRHQKTLDTSNELASYYQSKEHNEEALNLRTETFELIQKTKGPRHPDTLAAMHKLATTYLRADQYGKAIEWHEKALEITTKTLGPEHPDTLASMGNLANSYDKAHRYKDALPLLEKTLEQKRKILGTHHLDTLDVMSRLRNFYYLAGSHKKARALDEEILVLKEEELEWTKQNKGAMHPYTLDAMRDLAHYYRNVDRPDKMIAMSEEILNLRKQEQGIEHSDTLSEMALLVASYKSVDRNEDAVNLGREMLEVTKRTKGGDHPDTVYSMMDLAFSCMFAGRDKEATVLYNDALELSRKVLGPTQEYTFRIMDDLVFCYQRTKRLPESIDLLEQILTLKQKAQGKANPDTLRSARQLGYSYRDADRIEESITLLEDTLKSQKKTLGAEHEDTLRTMQDLVLSYQKAKRNEEALALNEPTLKLLEKVLGLGDDTTLESMDTLRSLYKGADRDEDAAQQRKIWLNITGQILAMKKKTLEVKQKKMGTTHPDTLYYMGRMAHSYWKAGQLKTATQQFREEIALRKKQGEDNWRLFMAQAELGRLLTESKQYSEAETLLLDSQKKLHALAPKIGTKWVKVSIDNLIKLYQSWSKPDKAAEWQATLEVVEKSENPPKA
ncbi:MAG: toll/interleukin-1 receptor domain-containing protein [Verrucomicrobiota bacterium]